MDKKLSHEIGVFEFNKDVELSKQKELMVSLNQCVMKYEGFLKRDYFYNDESGRWVDHLIWDSKESAVKAGEKIMKDPAVAPIFEAVNAETVNIGHYTQEG